MLKLSVGIPAHNEENNIGRLLQEILSQQGDFTVSEIIVVSDGSNDRTDEIVRSVADPRIRLFRHDVRRGLAVVQNAIIKAFTGDALLMVNADVSMPEPGTLDRLVRAFALQDRPGMVCPAILPLPAENFFESTINHSVAAKLWVYERHLDGNNIYLCHGRARLMAGDFARSMEFPEQVAEDAVSYIKCLESGRRFTYVPTARVYYRSPQNLADHLKQSKRFFRGVADLRGAGLAGARFRLPAGLLAKGFLLHAAKAPIRSLAYLGVLAVAFLGSFKYRTGMLWDEAGSSKRL